MDNNTETFKNLTDDVKAMGEKFTKKETDVKISYSMSMDDTHKVLKSITGMDKDAIRTVVDGIAELADRGACVALNEVEQGNKNVKRELSYNLGSVGTIKTAITPAYQNTIPAGGLGNENSSTHKIITKPRVSNKMVIGPSSSGSIAKNLMKEMQEEFC